MALTANTIPTIVGDAILEALKENLVYGVAFNEDYLGDVIPGNTVKIPSIGSVTVGNYVTYTDMDDEEVTDSSQSLVIDQQKYFSILLDDVDAALAKPAIMAAYAREAAFQMQKTMDSYLAGILAAGGTLTAGLGSSTTPLEINSVNISAKIRLVARKLDDALVPRSGRYIILPPWAVEDLTGDSIAAATDNMSARRESFVDRFAGFDIYMSQQVPNTASAKYKIIAGTSDAATMALGISKTEMLRHPSIFADKLRGLAVYGAKVTRAAALAVSTWNEAAES